MKEERKEHETKADEEQQGNAQANEPMETEENIEGTEEEQREETEQILEEKGEMEPEKEVATAPVEEEKETAAERKEKEEEIVEERIYTVPLGKARIMPPRKRTPRAVRMFRSFMIKHMKLEARKEGEEEEEPKKLTISNEVNEKIWGRGIEKPPRKIRVRAARDKEGNVTVYLAEGD